jgi:metal-responsive CopG/Arc/MetJ family transcriptional regulator
MKPRRAAQKALRAIRALETIMDATDMIGERIKGKKSEKIDAAKRAAVDRLEEVKHAICVGSSEIISEEDAEKVNKTMASLYAKAAKKIAKIAATLADDVAELVDL